MTDLTTRLLAEIERREGINGPHGNYGHGPFVDEMAAYLAALRKIVELHRLYAPPQYRGVPCCARCSGNGARPAMDYPGEGFNWPCPTIVAVAEGLGVAL